FEALEPEIRDRREHDALAGDRVRKYDVERGHSVAREDQQPFVVDAIDVAHFAASDQLQAVQIRFEQCWRRVHFVAWAWKAEIMSLRGASRQPLTTRARKVCTTAMQYGKALARIIGLIIARSSVGALGVLLGALFEQRNAAHYRRHGGAAAAEQFGQLFLDV